MSKARANWIDVHVGGRVRLRRHLLGVQPEDLGRSLGLTAEQIEKYEQGEARIGARDLQPWLGMLGHMIVVGPVTDGPVHAPIWAHVHSMIPPTPGMPGQPDESVAAYGPDVPFTYSFPLPGKYFVWIQVERDYRIVTVPAVVDVPAAKGGSGK